MVGWEKPKNSGPEPVLDASLPLSGEQVQSVGSEEMFTPIVTCKTANLKQMHGRFVLLTRKLFVLVWRHFYFLILRKT